MRPLFQTEGSALVVTMLAQGIDPSWLAQQLDALGVSVSSDVTALHIVSASGWRWKSVDTSLGTSRVLIRGEHRASDADLVTEFLRLDPSGGALELDARWSFVCAARGRPARAGRTRLQAQLVAATASAVAAATVDALSQFADVLAARTFCGEYSGERYRLH